jgi:hypothetical protein
MRDLKASAHSHSRQFSSESRIKFPNRVSDWLIYGLLFGVSGWREVQLQWVEWFFPISSDILSARVETRWTFNRQTKLQLFYHPSNALQPIKFQFMINVLRFSNSISLSFYCLILENLRSPIRNSFYSFEIGGDSLSSYEKNDVVLVSLPYSSRFIVCFHGNREILLISTTRV